MVYTRRAEVSNASHKDDGSAVTPPTNGALEYHCFFSSSLGVFWAASGLLANFFRDDHHGDDTQATPEAASGVLP